MAQIIIEIPDLKLPLVKAWVDSRVSDTQGWSDAQYAGYVDGFVTSHLRAMIYGFQQGEYLKDFVFDDPIE